MDIELLNKEIENGRTTLSTEYFDMSFGELLNMYNDKEIIINPEFQRLYRWTNEQQTYFIESLLLGIPIPPIFVSQLENGKWELIDGLQRLSTYFSFFGKLSIEYDKEREKKVNKWILQEGEIIKNLVDLTSDTLPFNYILNLKRTLCRVVVIKTQSNENMKYHLFKRLNTGGSPLTEMEIRNCLFRSKTSKFNNILNELAKYEKFINLVNLTDQKKSELYPQELVLRFYTLIYGSDKIIENISNQMDEFMQSTRNEQFDETEYKLSFLNTIDLLAKLNEHKMFKSKSNSFLTSLYDTIMLGTFFILIFIKNIVIY